MYSVFKLNKCDYCFYLKTFIQVRTKTKCSQHLHDNEFNFDSTKYILFFPGLILCDVCVIISCYVVVVVVKQIF